MSSIRSLKVLLVLALTSLVVINVVASKKAKPPATSDFVGVWAGYSDTLSFFRLELDADNTGYLCVSFLPNTPADLYRVSHWQGSDWSLELKLQPLDAEAEPITFRKLRFSKIALEGEVGGAKWSREITLINEREWQTRTAQVQPRIADQRKTQQP